jgi:acyl-CoA synthetase (AMP-forming)/AMP-acid ligase II
MRVQTHISPSAAYARGPAGSGLTDQSVGDLLRRAAELGPERPALIEGAEIAATRRRWTYAELFCDASSCASMLLDSFEPGSRIAVWSQNLPEYQVLQYGIALAGMVMVTVNPAFRRREVGYVLNRAEVSACFAAAAYRDRSPLLMAEDLLPELPHLRLVRPIDDLLVQCGPYSPASRDLPAVDPFAAAQILFTSGTTGDPKGAVLSHRSMTNNVSHAATIIAAGNEAAPVWLASLPMFHVASCVVAALGTASLHGALVTAPRFDAELALRLIEEERVTTMNQVPSLVAAIIDHPERPKHDLSSWTSVMVGGAPVPELLTRRLQDEHGITAVIGYGMTEAAQITMTRAGDAPRDKSGTCGQPMPCVEVKIVDPESGVQRDLGEVGEVLTRGYHTLMRYYGDLDATDRALTDGWLHTGDLGSLDDRGYLQIRGRAKDMIIRSGENVYPAEIEDQLMRLPSITEVAVVGLPDETHGEIVAAFIKGDSVDSARLAASLRSVLTGYKIPSKWFTVEDFPRTPSGKIRKFVLREEWLAGRHAEIGT